MEEWGGWMIRPVMATGQHLDKSIQWYSTYVMAQIKQGGPGQYSSIPKPSLRSYYRDKWAGWMKVLYCRSVYNNYWLSHIFRPVIGFSHFYTQYAHPAHTCSPPPTLTQKCQHVCKLSSVLLLGVVGGGGEWLRPQIYQPKRIEESGNANDVCCTSYFKLWLPL